MKLEIVQNGLVPIYMDKTGKEKEQLVDARDLHEFLEVDTKFTMWIKRRISDCRLVESFDYEVLPDSVRNSSGGRYKEHYALTTDAAKLISMMEKTDKGDQARRYFLSVEKKYREQLKAPTHILEAFIKELGPWAPIFPNSYYQALYKILDWDRDPNCHKRPGYIGKVTRDLIHSKLAPGVLEKLHELNPWMDGRRKHVHTQFLSDDLGKQQIKRQIDFVTRMARLCDDLTMLYRIVENEYEDRVGLLGDKQLKLLKVKYELADINDQR